MYFQVKKHFEKQLELHFQTQLLNILYMFFTINKLQL